MTKGSTLGQAGIPVDPYGGPTVDPTKNVLDLVKAANQRQDDLREAAINRIDGGLAAFKDYVVALAAERDKRFEQRFEGTQKALEIALAAQRDSLHAAFQAQKEAISAALASADRAVSKAETAAEKRFESQVSAITSLSEQMRHLMPRSEVSVVAGALTDKVQALETQLSGKLSALEKQFDAAQAERQGMKGGWGYAVGVVGFVLAIASLIMIGFKFVQATP